MHEADSLPAWRSAHAEAAKGARSTLERELGLRASVLAARRQRVRRSILPDITAVAAAVLTFLGSRGNSNKQVNLANAPLTRDGLGLFEKGAALVKQFHTKFVAKGLHGFEPGVFPSDFLPKLSLAEAPKAEEGKSGRGVSRGDDGKAAAKRPRLAEEEGESDDEEGEQELDDDSDEDEECTDYALQQVLMLSAHTARRASQQH